VDKYTECLFGWAETIKSHGGTVAANHELVTELSEDGRLCSIDKRKQLARERTLAIAIAIIRGADGSRYGKLISDLANQYTMGRDKYPSDVVSAKSLLVCYKTPVNAHANRGGATRTQPSACPEDSAMTFAPSSAIVDGTNGVTHDGIQCWTCQRTGHYAGECPMGRQTLRQQELD
jgi:hypothetical protein